MARGPEGKIQDAVVRYLKALGVLFKKDTPGRFNISVGWPDLTVFPTVFRSGRPPRVPFFIEFKAPGKGLTPLQDHVRTGLVAKGYKYYVVDDASKGKAIVNKECS